MMSGRITHQAIVVQAAYGLRTSIHGARLEVVVLAGIVGLGFFFRVYNLAQESLWLDEAHSLTIARMSLDSQLAWLANSDHPPLYFLLLHFWQRFGASEFWLRLPSAIIGTMGIFAIYALARTLFDGVSALMAALLLAISSVHVWYSQEVRSYVLVSLWTIVSSYFLVVSVRQGRTVNWVCYAITMLAGLYTHYFFVLLIPAHLAFLAYSWLNDAEAAQAIRTWGAVTAAVFGAFVPLLVVALPFLLSSGGAQPRDLASPPSAKLILVTLWYFGVGGAMEDPVMRYASFGVFLASVGSALLAARSRRDPCASPSIFSGVALSLSYIAVPILTLFVISQVRSVYILRYLTPFLPGYLLLLAVGINRLPRLDLKVIAIVAVVLLSANSLAFDYTNQQKDDWRSVAAYVTANSRSGDVVVFNPAWNYQPFDYYAENEVDVYKDLPGVITAQNVEQEVSRAAKDRKRIWLIRTTPASDSNGEITRYLDAHFKLESAARFRGIELVALYSAPPEER